jgi:hypothetical protein
MWIEATATMNPQIIPVGREYTDQNYQRLLEVGRKLHPETK